MFTGHFYFLWVACSFTLLIFLLVMLTLFNCKSSSYIKNTGHMHVWRISKRAPSENQREIPQRSSALLVPWSWTISLQNFVEIWIECTKILLTIKYYEVQVQCCRWCFCLFGAVLISCGRSLFTRSYFFTMELTVLLHRWQLGSYQLQSPPPRRPTNTDPQIKTPLWKSKKLGVGEA